MPKFTLTSTPTHQAPWPEIERHISLITGEDQRIIQIESVSGGDINQAFHVSTAHNSYFVKLNDARLADMFEAEFYGLSALGDVSPSPISTGTSSPYCFLIMEYLSLAPSDHSDNANSMALANQLVRLHQNTYSKFGWQRNNYIGSTPQSNTLHSEWRTFWWYERLLPQIHLTQKNIGDKILNRKEEIKQASDHLLAQHHPTPRLCHGDLWSGNKDFTACGSAYLFDPAPYYGDRETDLAMTELFGGFSQAFYTHYYRHFPLRDGYKKRKALYNLYHILNHVNLFQGSYISQALRLIDDICDQ